MKKLLLIAVLLFVGYIIFNSPTSSTLNEDQSLISEQSAGESDTIIADAFSNHQSNL